MIFKITPMNDGASAEYVVAKLKPCDQYRFRVEQAACFSRELRAEIRKEALAKANELFLKCIKNYHFIARVGDANLAFTDGRLSPSDSKSEFLHALVCLKTVELCFYQFRKLHPTALPREFSLWIETSLPPAARKYMVHLIADLGMVSVKKHDSIGVFLLKRRVGGVYRASRHVDPPFSLQPIRRLEIFKNVVLRWFAPWPKIKRFLNTFMHGMILLFWPFPILARLIFSFYYQAATARLLKKLDGPKNVFVYFDLRLGRNREVATYMRWKYGSALSQVEVDSSLIHFTHIARSEQVYSFAAMIWAYRALKMMEERRGEGCVVVNYLLPAFELMDTHVQRGGYQREVKRKLLLLKQGSSCFFENLIYQELMAVLYQTKVFPLELARSYRNLFSKMSAGVVIQADAVSKTARHFTASARKHGNRVLYVADRICTSLRTSNQLIEDGFGNLHFPNRFVVFDQVTRSEFVRQGVADHHIYSYARDFTVASSSHVVNGSSKDKVVILLQAYEDNMGGMVRMGAELLDAGLNINVIYQEHPNFPVCDLIKVGLMKKHHGRLSFLKSGEKIDYSTTLCLITGYSTAAVPGVLKGVPLIWLRRQVDNSIYGEAYLSRIGFVADKLTDVISTVKKLLDRDLLTLETCIRATEEAMAIFTPSSIDMHRDFSKVLLSAIEDSFSEIRHKELEFRDSPESISRSLVAAY